MTTVRALLGERVHPFDGPHDGRERFPPHHQIKSIRKDLCHLYSTHRLRDPSRADSAPTAFGSRLGRISDDSCNCWCNHIPLESGYCVHGANPIS